MPIAEPRGIVPDWPAPAAVRAFQTVRDPAPLDRLQLPAEPSWLTQVHGAGVARPRAGEQGLTADAAVASSGTAVLAVKTADCLPVLLCDRDGSVIGVAHAGWRGLAAGVLEATVAAMQVAPARLLAWFGPAIGPDAFEVGPEVRDALVADDAGAAAAFRPGQGDRLYCDIVRLATRRLARSGVSETYGGRWCTVGDPERFHSYRRDGGTGRMATLIWFGEGPWK